MAVHILIAKSLREVTAVQPLLVGASREVEQLKQSLMRILGSSFSMGEVSCGDLVMLTLNPLAAGDLKPGVSAALAEHVVEGQEELLLREGIAHHYGYFSPEEQDEILRHSLQHLAGAKATATAREVRLARVKQRFLEYFEGAGEVNLDGFVRFRLKDYLEELDQAIDQAVDDFLLEKEYREFIRLLRYFVDVQEPRLPLAHVFWYGQGHFRIADAEGRSVENAELKEFVVEMMDQDICYDDLMVSGLITLAPTRIIIHGRDEGISDESIRTVVSVFQERVELCRGCPMCEAERVRRAPSKA